MEDDDLAVTLEDGRRVPGDHAGVLQQDFGFMDDGEVTVSAAEKEDGECERSSGAFIHQRDGECVFTCCRGPGQVSICRSKGL